MNTIKAIITMMGVSVTASACGGTPLYGPKSCVDSDGHNQDMMAYLPPNANAAVCMPKAAAIYITCVRELSQSSFASKSDHSVDVKPKLSVSETKGGLEGEAKIANLTSITLSYSDEGRKQAFDYCAKLAGFPTTESTPQAPTPKK